MNPQTWLWIGTFGMILGGLAILAIGKRRTPAEEMHTVIHGIVPIIAACSYFAMAVGQGSVTIPDGAATGRVFYFARYIDWTFTTPLLLVTLSMTAMHAGEKRHGAILGVLLADVLMIVTAFAFGASETFWIKWTWFTISCGAFLAVYYVIWGPFMQANMAERDDVRAAYRRNAAILSVLWLIYPLLLAVTPDGLGTIGEGAGVASIAVLDLVSKVAYGLLTTTSDAAVTERDLASATRPTLRRTAA